MLKIPESNQNYVFDKPYSLPVLVSELDIAVSV
jgi:hypothetical protein